MDIEQYLQIEFEVYPRQFRDVAVYLAKSSALAAIKNVPNVFSCACCEAGEMHLKQEDAGGGVRYIYRCDACPVNSGSLQKSDFLAYWQYAAKHATPDTHFPVVDKHLLARQIEKFNSKGRTKLQQHLMLWNASLGWLKWVWKQHRSTADYMELGADDALVVDALGFLIDGLRKQTLSLMEGAGLDVYDMNTQESMRKCDQAIRDERKRYYPQYQSNLSPVFRYKIKDQLSIG